MIKKLKNEAWLVICDKSIVGYFDGENSYNKAREFSGRREYDGFPVFIARLVSANIPVTNEGYFIGGNKRSKKRYGDLGFDPGVRSEGVWSRFGDGSPWWDVSSIATAPAVQEPNPIDPPYMQAADLQIGVTPVIDPYTVGDTLHPSPFSRERFSELYNEYFRTISNDVLIDTSRGTSTNTPNTDIVF